MDRHVGLYLVRSGSSSTETQQGPRAGVERKLADFMSNDSVRRGANLGRMHCKWRRCEPVNPFGLIDRNSSAPLGFCVAPVPPDHLLPFMQKNSSPRPVIIICRRSQARKPQSATPLAKAISVLLASVAIAPAVHGADGTWIRLAEGSAAGLWSDPLHGRVASLRTVQDLRQTSPHSTSPLTATSNWILRARWRS